MSREKEYKEKGVSNNSSDRKISNALDSIPGFKNSSTRAYIHEKYHEHVANKKEACGNHEGAAKERARAAEQREKRRQNSPG